MPNVSHLNVVSGYDSLEEAFPEADSGHVPLGERVLVQVRTSKGKSKGGILLPADTKDTEQWNTQVGKMVAIGPLAFKNRKDGTDWPEGAWALPGEYVRVPKYGGDRWQVKYGPGAEDVALFVLLKDTDLLAKVKDPLTVLAFV